MNTTCRIITARFTCKQHRAAVAALIDEYRRGPFGDGIGLDSDDAARLIRGLRSHPGARVYLALRDGDAAGCAVCFTGFSTFAARPLLNIHDLIVTRRYRRMGIARALIRWIASDAAARGFCKLTLEVRSDNEPALSLYADEGFGPGRHLTYFLTKAIP